MRQLIKLLVILLSFEVFGFSISYSQQAERKYIAEKTLLYTFQEKVYPVKIVVSENRNNFAIEIGNKDKSYILSDALIKSRDYWDILNMNFSPDGSKLAFTAERKNRFYVVVDGNEMGPFNTLLSDTVVFSQNNKRYAFAAGYMPRPDKEDFFIVLDGEQGPKFDVISMEPPRFSPNGDRFIYIVRHKGKRFAILDGREGPKFEETGGGPFFSHDGSIVLYKGLRDDSGYVVVNDSVFGGYYGLDDPVISPNSLDIAYAGYKDSSSTRQVFINHQPMKIYYASKDPTFSPDGSRFAFWASDGKDQFAVVDSVEDEHFDNISDVRFSPDGNHYYYIVYHSMNPGKWSFVADGKLLPEMEGTLESVHIYFAPNGSRMAYLWDIDSTHENLIVDGVEYHASEFNYPVFSPDGKRFGVPYRKLVDSEWQLIIDSKETVYDKFIGPHVAFSPDSKDVAFYVYKDGDMYLVINDQKFELFDNIFPFQVRFNDDGNMTFYATKDNNFYRVIVRPEE